MRLMVTNSAKPVECLVDFNKAYKELEKRLSPPSDRAKRRKFINS